MKTSIFLAVLLLCAGQISFANYTLTDNGTGATYTCGAGGSTPVTDPDCVSSVTSYCSSNTAYNNTQCFDKATIACANANPNTANCISQTTSYCNSNTAYNNTQCFDKAVLSCRGNHLATLQLMENVRSHNIELQKALFKTQLKSLNQKE